ncbi:MAG: hypothetical protein NTX49_09120 [Chlamydiae bacterium]|nr:hypothetical protein [Chlamydiota bacterium]
MGGPVSSSSSNPLDRFYQECASIASGIPQLSTGRVGLQDKISAAYTSAIRDVEQKMESEGLSSSSDADKVRIISEGSAKLALIETAYKDALSTIAGPRVAASGAKPVGIASSAPQSGRRDPLREGFANLSNGMLHLQELGSAFLSPSRVIILSSKGSGLVAATQNVFHKIVKGLEVPRLHPSAAKPERAPTIAPSSESRAAEGASSAALVSQRNDFSKRFTRLLAEIRNLPETGPQESQIPHYSSLIKEGFQLLNIIDHVPHLKEELGPEIDILLSGIEYMTVEIQVLEENYTKEAGELTARSKELLYMDSPVNPRAKRILIQEITDLIFRISDSAFKDKLVAEIKGLKTCITTLNLFR